MTRFKELKRIEEALEHKSVGELQWALSYCGMRLQIAARKDQRKYWHQIQERVTAALAGLKKVRRPDSLAYPCSPPE